MTDLPTAQAITAAQAGDDHVTLTYDARFLRRKVLTAASGLRFLVDFAQTTSLGAGDAFQLGDGRRIAVRPASEALYEIRSGATDTGGGDLARLAWHIGNRHAPCQIGTDCLVIQRDRVMADMLARLGASVTEITTAFTPEGGAYGHGRTHGHDHGHGHGPGNGHSQEHMRDHDHARAHDHDDAHEHPHARPHGHDHAR